MCKEVLQINRELKNQLDRLHDELAKRAANAEALENECSRLRLELALATQQQKSINLKYAAALTYTGVLDSDLYSNSSRIPTRIVRALRKYCSLHLMRWRSHIASFRL